MEAATTIKQMIAGNTIFVPNYQRAYSWETETEKGKSPKQTNVFISDLNDYNSSRTNTPYYFGHFLFEEKTKTHFGIVDGQQRLTTIVIFLSALFRRLESLRKLTDEEVMCYEDIIRRMSNYKFTTVEYDNQLFKDYVIDQTKKDKNGLETESAKRIVNAFDYFTQYLSDKDEAYLTRMLNTVQGATCTTHPVKNESEAIQMFIFQNNRGKKPSNLEIIKAQFMYNIHLYGGEEKEALMKEVKNRFEKIYHAISSIEYSIQEDEVLTYTLRVHFNSLWEGNAITRINELLSESNPIPFIKSFTNSLAVSFDHLKEFFGKDEREHIEIHSLVNLGSLSLAIPFLLKAYRFGLNKNQICQLCSSFESLLLRQRLIGSRAEMTSRLQDVYKNFTQENSDIQPIQSRINWMKNLSQEHGWWAYWNNVELKNSIQGAMHHSTARFILWKYENHLNKQGNGGYLPQRFEAIASPELEHIAPQKENPNSGYCTYDDEFRNQYLNCLGNYLLLPKIHNGSIGNKPFPEKLKIYDHLIQHREVKQMVENEPVWTKEHITKRKDKLVDFILETF
jgi:hypothetical protein